MELVEAEITGLLTAQDENEVFSLVQSRLLGRAIVRKSTSDAQEVYDKAPGAHEQFCSRLILLCVYD